QHNQTMREASCSSEDWLAVRQKLEILDRAVAELPPKCRQVFLLRKVEQLSHAEIAERLGISRSMVEKHLHRAMMHCRDRIFEP
ncbi:MAG: sigma-70 family RNA polymerase sigma factor, partial [Methylococcales bacterium]